MTEELSKDEASAPADATLTERRNPTAERDAEADGAINPEGDGANSAGNPPRKPERALVTAAMAEALTSQARLALEGQSPLALIVSAPTNDWILPLKKFFDARAFQKSWDVYARDGSDRYKHKSSEGNSEVAYALSRGKSVVGIAVDPKKMLPSTLVAAADLRIDLRMNETVIRKTIIELYDQTPLPIDGKDLTSLGFDDIVSVMRPESDASAVVARIVAAAAVRDERGGTDDAPILATAVEYGAAREWGLALAQDMRDYRAGLIPWSALDRGAIFFSDPGMGKSLLARSLARACEVNLVVGSIGELFATSAGNLDGVIKSMRELFARAKAAAPVILFLDEIDGLPSRESLDSKNRDWWMPVIEDFMLQLDDATSGKREGVVVIGATNRIHAVDPAILRPGRLERAIEVKAPGPDGILNILRFHVRGALSDGELRTIVGLIEGFTPAEIMEIVRSARRKARQQARDLSIDDLRDTALPEPEHPLETVYRFAVHEAGHVVVALSVGAQITSVRIGGRSGVGGVTNAAPDPNVLLTRGAIEDRVVGMLAGRAAELVILGAASSGAGGDKRSDLARSTNLLAIMDLSLGLGDEHLVYLAEVEDAHGILRRDRAARRRIDEALKRLQQRSVQIVRERRAQVTALADALVYRRFLSADDIGEILSQSSSRSDPSPDLSEDPL